MIRKQKYSLVLVTAPEKKTARKLARKVLEEKLVACVHLVPGIESHYWWMGKIDSGREILMLLKTSNSKLKALEKLILAAHPYETPEFVVLDIAGGSLGYLDWIAGVVKGGVNRE
jgi:periplasmic divalent cation tolerance protein